MPDPASVSAALQQGEIDWWSDPPADLIPLLAKSKGVVTPTIVPTGLIATMRFNHMQAPFNNPAIRRALIGAIQQSDYMTAVMGDDRSGWADHVGYFCPGTPMASTAGMERLNGPRIHRKNLFERVDIGLGHFQRLGKNQPIDVFGTRWHGQRATVAKHAAGFGQQCHRVSGSR